jgi:hypothetical protein
MRSTRFAIPLVLAGLALGACGDDKSPSGVQEGRLTIQLTDAPGDLAEAFIRIEEFVLIGAASDGGIIRIQPEVAGYIDLLTLAGGQVLEVVDDALVPTGTYSELRLVIDDAYVRLNDGRIFATAGADLPSGVTADGTLKCPSCSQSGFKVKFMNGPIQIADEATVLLDFDVAQTFGHEAGASGMWIMRPVLHATTQSIQLGRIVGDVELATDVTIPECGGQTNTVVQFRPIAVMGDDTITAAVNSEGEFRFTHVLPGTWTLGHMPSISFTNDDTLSFTATVDPATVNVAEADSAMATYQITAAACN